VNPYPFSPHKFLGGPGSSGVLVFNKKIYRTDLPPTTAGGGTILYVGFKEELPEFSADQSFEPVRVERSEIPGLRQSYLADAETLAKELEQEEAVSFIEDDREIEELKSFYYVHRT
jgi:selenocysteine lyase/cysteine desulfurase